MSGVLRVAIVLIMAAGSAAGQVVELPPPEVDSDRSLERALSKRRSHRRHARTPLSKETLGQLLWAAQGVTGDRGKRTAPSAGARYPLEIYVLLRDGVFQYLPVRHALRRVTDKDRRSLVWKHTYARARLAASPVVFVIAAVYERTERKYGASAKRFVHIEVGHVGQNILLQATALGLRSVPVGAFHQRRVQATLGLAEVPVYFIVVGQAPAR